MKLCTPKWAMWSKKVPLNMRKMCRFRSSCTSEMYHPCLCSPFLHSVVSNDSVSRKWRLWSDCSNGQADLGLLCLHMPKNKFSHGVGQIKKTKNNIFWIYSFLTIVRKSQNYLMFWLHFYSCRITVFHFVYFQEGNIILMLMTSYVDSILILLLGNTFSLFA